MASTYASNKNNRLIDAKKSPAIVLNTVVLNGKVQRANKSKIPMLSFFIRILVDEVSYFY
jgi:hypothetical protein